MPNVPNVPGVPNLSSYSLGSLVLLVVDQIVFGLLGGAIPQWGIYFNGIPVIAADSTVSFDFRQDFPISDYPVEQGGFQSYNKVQLPAEIKLRVASGGSEVDRQEFLDSIEAVINTTTLYDVVTPEQTYLGYCFSHRDFHRRSNSGVGMIIVDLWMTEVRTSSSATFQSTQQPGEAGVNGVGNVQPQTATSGVEAKVQSTIAADGGGW